MLILKRLSTAVFLTCALAATAWADCPDPGVMGTPCVPTAQTLPDDSIGQGQMDATTHASEALSVDLPALVEIALNVLTLY